MMLHDVPGTIGGSYSLEPFRVVAALRPPAAPLRPRAAPCGPLRPPTALRSRSQGTTLKRGLLWCNQRCCDSKGA